MSDARAREADVGNPPASGELLPRAALSERLKSTGVNAENADQSAENADQKHED
jgi:hypothetical protein